MLPNKANLLLLISLLLLAASYVLPDWLAPSPTTESKRFELILQDKLSLLQTEIERLEEAHEDQSLFLQNGADEWNHIDGMSFYIYEEDSLIFWTEDELSIEPADIFEDKALIQTENAWLLKRSLETQHHTYYGLILLQYEYPLENQFLQNHLHPDFESFNFYRISDLETDFPIQNAAGEIQYYLLPNENTDSVRSGLFSIILLLAGACLLFYQLSKIRIRNRTSSFFILAASAIGLRLLLFYLPPHYFELLNLFQAEWFAINWVIPSEGDLFLHLILIFYLLYQYKKRFQMHQSKSVSILFLFLALTFGIFFINLINWSIQSSIVNFDFSNFYQLNYLSFIAFFCFSLAICISFLLIDLGLRYFTKKLSFKKLCSYLATVFLLFLLIGVFLLKLHWIHLWIFIPAIILLANSYQFLEKNIFSLILLLVFCGSTIAFWMNQTVAQKNDLQQQSMVQKLAEERDPVAEYLFAELQDDLRNDENFSSKLNNYWEKKEEMDDYLKEIYFSSYWDKYQINFTICTPEDSLIVEGNRATSCRKYFQNRIRLEGSMVSSTNLFQLSNLAGRIDYIGEIELQADSIIYYLYVELSSIYLNENEGYPELLIDDKSKKESVDLTNYSYAVYDQNELVYKNGPYNYSSRLQVNELSPKSFYQYQTLRFQHLVFQKNQQVAIMLSRLSPTFFDFLTTLAYVLVILSIVFVICAVSLPHFPYYFNLNWHDFSTKIQFFLVSSLLSALIFLAWGTTYFIQEQYQAKNSNNLDEKIRSVNIELESKIGQEEFLSSALNEYVSRYLVKFSNVFYSDINLYNTNGSLYSTSRPEVFVKGIKSKRMNPIAFQALSVDRKAQWIQEEQIGDLSYLSAYIPFKNYENEVIGYLNLPYFIKQGELEKEISSFLVSTLNIYVGFFALALLISVLLINQLSKPLLLIRQQISKLKLGSSIELIDWKSNDEIGALVQEYNRIAIELNESAAQLARTEREVAWREMAKQVAHEIKNPLTPMKLTIQHLQRSAAANPDDLSEKINRTTETLIEQIETLSSIATAFSSFAKLPSKEFIDLDIIPIIRNTIELYSHDLEIQFIHSLEKDKALVRGDKDQLLRLFNNLIKNAIQAIEEDQESLVKVMLAEVEGEFQIQIYDNGVGITEEQAERIFEPNFTTKTSGSGLGLAMSKSIIEQMGGSISFKSSKKLGTTFYIHLPKA